MCLFRNVNALLEIKRLKLHNDLKSLVRDRKTKIDFHTESICVILNNNSKRINETFRLPVISNNDFT